jgi:4-hydroxy-tetrahydrodipicolinate synthase
MVQKLCISHQFQQLNVAGSSMLCMLLFIVFIILYFTCYFPIHQTVIITIPNSRTFMKPLKSVEIFGTWGTLLLPLNNDDSINYEKLADSIDTMIGSGVSGIYSNGTAGEFYNQTEEEFDQVNEILAKKCNAVGMPFQIGCCHMSPIISLERIKRIKHLEPGAIQVILPDWWPPTMPEIIDFLKVMTEAAAPVGLVLYNPPHAKVKLTPQNYQEIQQAGIGLVGCKTAGGDESWYEAMKQAEPKLSVFVPGHHLATGVKFGAHGSYSNVACINPKVAQDWYKMMLTDIDAALAMQTRIQAFITQEIFPLILEEHYSNQSIDKFLAALTGWADTGTRIRWPYRWLDESRVAPVREVCRVMLPEFFTSDLEIA